MLNGLPLLAHSIKYSNQCKLVDYTFVSTDSEEYAKISIEHGAQVPFLRPFRYAKKLSQDYEFLLHSLTNLEKFLDKKIDYLVLLRPTSPLRPSGLIEGLKLMNDFPNGSSVRSVKISNEHPFRSWQKKGKYIFSYMSNIVEPYNLPRQKLPNAYYQTGDIEIIKRKTILSGSASGNKVIPLIIKDEDMFDIDTEEDFEEVKNKIESKKNN